MDRAIFAGSFDPLTKGHLNIILRASKMVDTLFVAIGKNEDKEPFYSITERVNKLKFTTRDIKNIKIITFDGLLTDCAKSLNTRYLIRSIRNLLDYEYEKNLGQIYKSQNIDIECIYILAEPNLAHISSTVTKQLIKLGGNTKDYEV